MCHTCKIIRACSLSDTQVTTVRSALKKPDIPFCTDPVSKLQAIGKDTMAKLKDLTAAAAASTNPKDADTLQDFCTQINSITTGVCIIMCLVTDTSLECCTLLSSCHAGDAA